MFTGLIETTGTVVSLTPTDGATRLILAAPALAGRWRTGDSIAVNGVCLTAIPSPDPTHFAADLAGETLARTTLGALPTGATVNLELPTPAGSPLGGHVVQGHVDATGTLLSIRPASPRPRHHRLASHPRAPRPSSPRRSSRKAPSPSTASASPSRASTSRIPISRASRSPSSPTPTNPPTCTPSRPALRSTSKPTSSPNTPPPNAPAPKKTG